MRTRAKLVEASKDLGGTTKCTVEIPNAVDPTKPHRIELPNIEDFENWRSGVHVQQAFPYLTREVREIFITGIGPDDWAKLFPPEEDE
jgi:hypothetical protein